MKIGIRGHDLGKFSPEALAEKYVSLGIESVQLPIPKAIEGVDSYFDVSDAILSRIEKAFSAGGISIGVLGCYIDPALTDSAERQKQLDTFKRGIYCAGMLKADCIGTETTVYSGPEEERGKALDILYSSLEDLLAEAAKHNVTIAVEPVSAHTMSTPKLTNMILKRFEGSGLKAIFDPLNVFTPAYISNQNDLWAECFEEFGSSIMALHVKDAVFENGVFRDCNLGEGIMDYSFIAKWLHENRPEVSVMREGIPPAIAEKELNWIRNIFKSA